VTDEVDFAEGLFEEAVLLGLEVGAFAVFEAFEELDLAAGLGELRLTGFDEPEGVLEVGLEGFEALEGVAGEGGDGGELGGREFGEGEDVVLGLGAIGAEGIHGAEDGVAGGEGGLELGFGELLLAGAPAEKGLQPEVEACHTGRTVAREGPSGGGGPGVMAS